MIPENCATSAAVEHDQRTCMQLSYNLLRP